MTHDENDSGMREPTTVESAAEALIRAESTQDAAVDIGEGLFDVFVSGGAFDAVPFVRSIAAAFGGISAVSDAMFQRKLNAAVSGFGDATDEDRARFRSKVDDDHDRADIGERLIYTIAAATSALKARLIGQAFRRFLDGECDKPTLRRTIDAIGQALAEDLHELVASGADALDDATYERLASLGLVTGGPSILTDDGGPVVATRLGALLL